MMYNFCTYFDQNYLSRGLALYHSLREHCSEFSLWVLCMDQASFEILEKLALPSVCLLSLDEFEQNDGLLIKAKQDRSKVEYYFTCTPSLPLYIFNNWPEVDLITYLDADLFFFASPEPLFEEIGERSIAIIGHRFSPQLKDRERYGIYNVGWLSFRRDDNALECLQWWRRQCIAWCYDREEEGRFADQKYLDDWPDRFKNVVVVVHKGANLAPWNVANYELQSLDKDIVMVDELPLIFFHFHGLKKILKCVYDPSWIEYRVKSSHVLLRRIYSPYLGMISDVTDLLNRDDKSINYNSSRNIEQRSKIVSPTQERFFKVYRYFSIGWNILTRKLIISMNGYTL